MCKTELAYVGGQFNGQLDEYGVGEELCRRAWRVGGVLGSAEAFRERSAGLRLEVWAGGALEHRPCNV